MKTLVWVTRNEVLTYSMDEVPSELGPKAAGLLEIPSAWTPDFVVVSPDASQRLCHRLNSESREDLDAMVCSHNRSVTHPWH